MKSVVDDLRREQVARLQRMTVDERIRLSISLGEEAARAMAHAQGISVAAARRALQRQRQVGRRPSACHDALLA
jgi:hypothetical protein